MRYAAGPRHHVMLRARRFGQPMGRLFAILAAIAGLAQAPVAPAVPAAPVPAFLKKPPASLRLMTWNIYRDSIFPSGSGRPDPAAPDRPGQFARVIRAVQPDVLCLQQVTRGATATSRLIDRILPLGTGGRWRAFSSADTVIASRYRISETAGGRVQDGLLRRGHAIGLIKAPATELYLICAHFQSSDLQVDIDLRDRQAEMVIRTIRTAKVGQGPVRLRRQTPFVILGDFNAIPGATGFVDAIVQGLERQPDGDVASGLDWDGTPLTDARPVHNGAGTEIYTWRNDLEEYPSSALDRIFYSDSVLTSVNQFVLDTMEMSEAELAAAGLRSGDVMSSPGEGVHDHLPLVIDVVPKPQPSR